MSVNPRQVAAEVLIDVQLNGAYSNLLLPKVLLKSELAERDKGLVTELVYGTLRLKGRHDQRISAVADRPIAEIDPKVLVILEMGVHQLLEMRIPDHAAVSATVDVARRTTGEGSSSFVNAILRQIIRAKDESDEVSTHPEWIRSSYLDALKSGSEVLELIKANNVPVPPTLVAWPKKSTKAELIELGAEDLAESKYAVTFSGNPAALAPIRTRTAGVQDYGSQLVTEIFAATKDRAGLRWLDLCAGPGGKSALLTAILDKDEDFFIANEISKPRAELVRQVVSFGEVISEDGRTLNAGQFDRIILDAPCSGIGALRRRPELRWRRTLNDVKNLVELQSELLDSAVRQLSPGGVLAYVTCSPHLHETKQQVRTFLKRHQNYTLQPITSMVVPQHYRSAINEDGTIQLWTHKHGTDAMYMALLRKENSEGN